MSATMTTNNDQKTNGAGQADMQTTTVQQAGQATTGRAGWGVMKGLHAGLLACILLLGLNFEAAADEEDPPTVSLTAPAANSTYIFPATITLTADAHAGESDAHIDKVEFFVNGVEIGEDSTAPYQINYTPPATGTYALKARAKDDHNQSTTSATVTVTVVANQAPTVSLTSPAQNSVAAAPGNFTLSANATDPDGSIARVEFYSGATLLGTVTSAPYTYTWSNVAAGSYSLTAKATDNRGATTTSAPIGVTSNAAPTISLTAPNAGYTAPAAITLNASAADTDGTITKVDFYNGATLIGTASTAPYSYTWSNVPAGSHSLTAIATDNLGAATTSAAVAITVIAPPAVSLTGPANNTVQTAPASFTLSATATSAGSIARVEFYNGATLIGSATTAPYSAAWSNVPAGSYMVTAVATDGNGATTTSAPVSVTSNAAPAISITAPAANSVLAAPASFTFTVDATDPDGTITKVDFYNGTILLGTATAAPYSHTWNNIPAGAYTITAVATDNAGAQTTSAAVTVIADAPPAITLTSPIANAVSVAPGSFTLTADASSITSTIARVEFYAVDSATNTSTLIGTATTNPYSYTWTNVPAGSYTLTAVATDSYGISTTSTAVSVTSDAPPAVTLTDPVAGSQITSPNSFTLTATAGSVTSSIAKVEFYATDNATNTGTLIGTVTSAPYTYTWTNVPVGNYTLSAIATDTLGIATTSATVTVAAIANIPPTVSLTGPATGTTVTVPGSFTLTASAGSVTSALVRVEFYANNGTGNTLLGTATANPYTYTWTNVPVGNYTLTAVATDAFNASTTSSPVTVTVNTGIAQAYYIHTDHLDTPRAITDTNGNIVWQWDNTDPFGNNAPNENPNNQGAFTFNLRFPGQYFDKETNLNYNVNRDYDPNVGRYIQSDPIGLAGGISTYAYVGGNPLSLTDSPGLCPMCYVAWVIGSRLAAGAAVGTAFDATLQYLATGSVSLTQALVNGLDAAPLGIVASNGSQCVATSSSKAVSTFRYTTEGEIFFHYGNSTHASNFAGGLRPGGYATSLGNLTGDKAQSGLALPHLQPPNAVYTVTPQPGTLVRVNPVAQPKFDQPGGLPEFQFPLGTAPGTVSGPRLLP